MYVASAMSGNIRKIPVKMRSHRVILSVVSVLLLLSGCSNGGQRGVQDKPAVETAAGEIRHEELPLPEVPTSLTAPEERAEYIIAHFWDGMDFSDTLRCHDRDFMELNFVNYLSLFPHVDPEALPPHIDRLLGQAAADPRCLDIVNNLAEHYLGDPNSPMRDEEYYILFLEGVLRLPGLSEDERIRPEHRLETARKNRPGTTATDFAYTDRDGKRSRLHATGGGLILLIFYDPDCNHCSEILEELRGNEVIGSCVKNGELTVLAVYTEGDRRLWDDTKSSLPQEWTVAIDGSGIVEHELYDLPAMPVIYLLDGRKTVLLKDAVLPEIERTIAASVR